MAGKRLKKPECFKCEHFYITWDKKFPNGCKVFKFKTRRVPSVDVLESSAQECLGFELRKHRRGSGGYGNNGHHDTVA